MRHMALAVVLVLSVTSQAQNLIQNPGFESGAIPTDGDQVAVAVGWNRNCGRAYASHVQSGIVGSPDLFDQRSPNCLYRIPDNKWGVRPARAGGYRYAGISGASNLHGPSYFGETVEGTLIAPLNSCTYEVSFWVSAIDGGKQQCNQQIAGVPPDPNNRLEVVLRRGSDCAIAKSVYVSSPITSQSWEYHSGQFTLAAADVAAGYDRIEFRLTQIDPTFGSTTHTVYIDDVGLTPAAQTSLSSDFQLAATWGVAAPTFQLTATMPAAPDGAGFWWKVDELSLATGEPIPNTTMENPAQWWQNPTINVFDGYYNNHSNAGVFLVGHKYRIERAVWSGCVPWVSTVKTVFFGTN